MTYHLLIERVAQKALADISKADQDRIISAIEQLSTNPRPQGARKLDGRDAWRIRVGVYRVIYEIDDDRLIVLIIRVGHRRDVYRR